MANGISLVIRSGGELQCLYNEELDLSALGPNSQIHRASNVEPVPHWGWMAEIIDGPTLGPFEKRSQALGAEAEWIRENVLKQAGKGKA